MFGKKLITINIIVFILFLILLFGQIFIDHSNTEVLTKYFIVIILACTIFIVLSVISLIFYIVKLCKNIKEINKNNCDGTLMSLLSKSNDKEINNNGEISNNNINDKINNKDSEPNNNNSELNDKDNEK